MSADLIDWGGGLLMASDQFERYEAKLDKALELAAATQASTQELLRGQAVHEAHLSVIRDRLDGHGIRLRDAELSLAARKGEIDGHEQRIAGLERTERAEVERLKAARKYTIQQRAVGAGMAAGGLGGLGGLVWAVLEILAYFGVVGG